MLDPTLQHMRTYHSGSRIWMFHPHILLDPALEPPSPCTWKFMIDTLWWSCQQEEGWSPYSWYSPPPPPLSPNILLVETPPHSEHIKYISRYLKILEYLTRDIHCLTLPKTYATKRPFPHEHKEAQSTNSPLTLPKTLLEQGLNIWQHEVQDDLSTIFNDLFSVMTQCNLGIFHTVVSSPF